MAITNFRFKFLDEQFSFKTKLSNHSGNVDLPLIPGNPQSPKELARLASRQPALQCASRLFSSFFGSIIIVAALIAGESGAQNEQIAIGRDSGGNQRWSLSVNNPAGFQQIISQGEDWGNPRQTSAIAFGNVDGDARMELVVGRTFGGNMRWAVHDDAATFFNQVSSQGEGWGNSRGVTALATGDVDGDGLDEIVVGRNLGGNMRWAVHDDAAAGFVQLTSQGEGWGNSRGVTALAVGDVDGDGRDEIVVGRNSGGNMRWAVHDDAAAGFVQLTSQGEGWGNSRGVIALAVGDVDGDGRDEIVIGRSSGNNMRWAVHDDAVAGFAQLTSQGEGWGDSRGVSALAVGDVDGDGRDEIVVGRNPGNNMRWAVHDDAAAGFVQLISQGEGWGDSRGASALATGDVDGDGLDEIVVGRNPGNNMRWAVHDDFGAGFTQLTSQGEGWGSSRSTTTLAVGDSGGGDQDGDGLLDIWETEGINTDGLPGVEVDLPAMGANPLHKDIFLELDWAAGEAPNYRAIQRMKDAFANAPINAGGTANPDGQAGINLWVDTGGLIANVAIEGPFIVNTCSDGIDNNGDGVTDNMDSDCISGGGNYRPEWIEDPTCNDGLDNDGDGLIDGTDPHCLVGDNLGGGNQVGGNTPDCLGSDFYTAKNNNFNSNRALAFRYGISSDPAINPSCAGGRAELGGNDFVDYNHDGGTIMHELGHTLNLEHGGDTTANCKPNYLSVMNYDLQFGIPNAFAPTLDYSPPRFAGGRGAAPMPPINEAGPNETIMLDPTDAVNRAVWVSPAGTKIQSNVNMLIDFDNDGNFLNPAASANIDTANTAGNPVLCTNNSFNNLTGWDDWTSIALNFRQFGDSDNGPINPTDEPHPTREQVEQLWDDINTTDLEIIKTAMPEIIQAGWNKIEYTVTVNNLGPNPANYVVIHDVLPSGTTLQNSSVPCVEVVADTLSCNLGSLMPGQSVGLTLTVLTDAAITYAGFASITNTANVESHQGSDSDESNNRDSATTRVVPVAALWYGLPNAPVKAVDQFGAINFDLYTPDGLLTPAAIRLSQAPFFNGVHLMSYPIDTVDWDPNFDDLRLNNHFGQFMANTTSTPHHLLVPTTKNLHEFPDPPETVSLMSVPHYLCYDIALEGPLNNQQQVSVSDQFGPNRVVNLDFTQVTLCNPADKNEEGIENPEVPHLMCVATAGVDPVVPLPNAFMRNQFGHYERQIEREIKLCVATSKTHDDCNCDADTAADLAVFKRAKADRTSANSTNIVRYNVQVTNNGPNAATDIVVQDALTMVAGTVVNVPASEFQATHGAGWSIASQNTTSLTLEASIDSLAAGETAQLHFAVFVQIAQDQSRTELLNVASAEGTVPDPDISNNSDSVNTVIRVAQ